MAVELGVAPAGGVGVEVAQVAADASDTPYFFSGYDCDSLALEGITHFTANFFRSRMAGRVVMAATVARACASAKARLSPPAGVGVP